MRLTWPHVAVIGMILAGVVTLGAMGRDATALIGLALALLIGLGLVAGQQQGIKDATNGNMARLVSLVEAMAKQLREMPPSTPPGDPTQQPEDR